MQIPAVLEATGIFCRKKMPGLKSKGVEDTGKLVGTGSPAGLAVYPVEGAGRPGGILPFEQTADRLTDASQLVNIDELARVAKKYGLAISVAGAADSATGTPDINSTLSVARADFIVAELLKRGIPEVMIQTVSNGGIADFTPIEANRHTRVELYFPLDK